MLDSGVLHCTEIVFTSPDISASNGSAYQVSNEDFMCQLVGGGE